jgi:polyhydroxybutyrate depolymerase
MRDLRRAVQSKHARSIVGLLLLGAYAGACGSAGSRSNATPNGSPMGRVSTGSDAQSSAGSDATTIPVDASDEGGLATDDGGVSSDDGGLPSGDGGISSADSGVASDGGIASDDGAVAICVSPDAGSTASAPGYLGDWTSGDYPSDFIDAGDYLTISGVTGQMGNTRQYAVHVPTGYDQNTPIPALFCLHGLGQTAALFCLDTGVAWPDKGDQESFVVIMPNGYMNSWNGGTCCGGAAQAGLDDVSLMRAIFAEVGTHVNIDLGRVYATGLSNGAFLSYRLACEASDLFVAVAPSAGAIGTAAVSSGIAELTTGLTTDLTSCTPTNPISVLDIHGTADPLIPYSTQAPSLAVIQASNGCSTTTAPATVVPSGGDTTCVSFAGCPTCPNVNVTGCSIADGGHCWFGSSDCGTGAGSLGTAIVGNNSNFMQNTSAIWSFFAQLAR